MPLTSLLRTIYQHPYNRQHPIGAFYRLTRWQFDKRTRGQTIYPFWGTRKIICYPDSLGSMWLVYNNVMDWYEFDFIKRFLRPGDIAFDIGANIGIYSLWMSQFSDHVYAFEPDEKNYTRALENIKLNHLSVTLERLALSDCTGELSFSIGRDMENRIARNGDLSVKVPCMTLDDYCAQHEIDHVRFIKIDVEGAEHVVFRGASRMLSKVDVIQLEMADAVEAFNLKREDVRDILAPYGFQLFTYSDSLQPIKSLDNSPQNIFAIRDLAFVNQRFSSFV